MKLEHPQVQLCKKKTQVLEWHQKQGSFPTLLGATVTWGQEATECKTSGLPVPQHPPTFHTSSELHSSTQVTGIYSLSLEASSWPLQL